MHYINHNGHLLPADKAALPHDNRAFRYGYGLFETMLLRDGAIRLEDYHWQRLTEGLQLLQLELPQHITTTQLRNEVVKTATKNQLQHLCRIRLQLYASSGGLYDAPNQKVSFLIECFPLRETGLLLNENGLKVGIAEGLYKSADALSNIKSCSALTYAMAARMAKAHKWNDALILNAKDHLIESTIANIFWVRNRQVYTAPLSDGCVAGVMRRHVMTVLPAAGIPVQEQSLSRHDLPHIQELFLTNAIRGIQWVGEANGNIFANDLIRFIYHQLPL